MEQAWRWFGPDDPVTLDQVKQAGATGIVTALHHRQDGTVWPDGEVRQRRDEIAAAEIHYEKLFNDRKDEHGPFDIVGDVHGCRAELESLLIRLGWELVRDERGRPVDAVHPEERKAVFVGDLVDRGPDSPGVLRLVMGMVAAGHAICVPGNHEQKLARKLNGRKAALALDAARVAGGVHPITAAASHSALRSTDVAGLRRGRVRPWRRRECLERSPS